MLHGLSNFQPYVSFGMYLLRTKMFKMFPFEGAYIVINEVVHQKLQLIVITNLMEISS